MIVGLVAITPCAGYVSGSGAIWVGLIASSIVWFSWTYFSRVKFMKKVDDAMGVFHTHGVAGLCGGLLVGILADPAVTIYQSANGSPFVVRGWLYGNRHQFFIQLGAAVTIIIYDALMTFIILRVIRLFTPLRMPEDVLEAGDLAVHGELAYPADEGYTRVNAFVGSDAVPVGGRSGTDASGVEAPSSVEAGETR